MKTIAFLGNRYGSLSRTLFLGLLRANSSRPDPARIVVVDTSSQDAARVMSRVRNFMVNTAKRLVPGANPTHSLDWFKEDFASEFETFSPPQNDINNERTLEWLESHLIDGAIVGGCDQLIRENFLSCCPKIINYHNGLLPEYRGVAAVQWAIYNREPTIGFTFHTIESKGIDRGRVVFSAKFDLDIEKGPDHYSQLLDTEAAKNMGAVIDALLSDWPPPGDLVEKGRYYSRTRFEEKRRLTPHRRVSDLIWSHYAMGGLIFEIQFTVGKLRLRITKVEQCSKEVPTMSLGNGFKISTKGIVMECKDGPILLKSINYVPSLIWMPLIWLFSQNNKE